MTTISPELKKILEGNCVSLASVSSDSSPNLIAVEVNKVISPNQLLITDNFFDKTKANLASNPNVSVAVWSRHPLMGFQLKGVGQYYEQGEYQELVASLNPGLSHKGYLIVTIKEIWDLANPQLISEQTNI